MYICVCVCERYLEKLYFIILTNSHLNDLKF